MNSPLSARRVLNRLFRWDLLPTDRQVSHVSLDCDDEGNLRGIMVAPIPSKFTFGELHYRVTPVTLANNTTLAVNVTVPPDKRWKLLTMKATNVDNVARSMVLSIYTEPALTNLVMILAYFGGVGASGRLQWPNVLTKADTFYDIYSGWGDVYLEAGHTLNMVWTAGGASAGGTAADGYVLGYLEWDI